MDEHFKQLGLRYEEISAALSQPELARDQARFQALMKDLSLMEPQISAYQAFLALRQEEAGARALLALPEMKELAEEELADIQTRLAQQEEALQLMMLPRDADDERNVVMEIRAGAGGDEAALFASLLLRMYTRFAERNGLQTSLLSLSESDLGGVKEAVLAIRGQGAFSLLKYESGVHRVQRVPSTESQGRIHTSTATVAVLPEWDDVQIEIAPGDLRVDVFRSGGHGGQSVNTTDSAVRITHLPTGIVATCQNEKSQIKNREQALKVLKLRLHEKALREQEEAYAEHRRDQVGTGDRSERIRTYNFPQGRVSDHRIGLTLYQIEQVMDGDLLPFVQALALDRQKRQLEAAKV